MQKLEGEEAELLLIVPLWTIRPWFPLKMQRLIRRSCGLADGLSRAASETRSETPTDEETETAGLQIIQQV